MFNTTAILVTFNGVGETVAEVMSLVGYVSTFSATHSCCRIVTSKPDFCRHELQNPG